MAGVTDKVMVVLVNVHVKEGHTDEFLAASMGNGKGSVQEKGIARFDCARMQGEPNKFVFAETFCTAEGPADHKATDHYAAWAAVANPIMEEPRTNKKYDNVFPGTLAGWNVLPSLASGAGEPGDASELLVVHVFVSVKEGDVEAFTAATITNATNSVQEPGVARFDVLQQQDDPTKFVLVEVYSNPEAPAEHKATAHYAAWADTVKDMMAEPRSNIKYTNCFPTTDAGWRSSP